MLLLKKLYTLKPVTGTPSMGWNFPSLSDQDRLWLNRLVSSIEIRATLFSMVADKAPGLDGYTTGFFQKIWHIVEKPVVSLILKIFLTGSVPAELNQSINCLIPNVIGPVSLNQFRHISLC